MIKDGKMTITPEDIPTHKGGHFWNAFGSCETDISARWLVRFAKAHGIGWEPFTESDIERFYNASGFRGFGFNHLISGDWVILVPKGTVGVIEDTYHFTEDFISRCHKSATRR